MISILNLTNMNKIVIRLMLLLHLYGVVQMKISLYKYRLRRDIKVDPIANQFYLLDNFTVPDSKTCLKECSENEICVSCYYLNERCYLYENYLFTISNSTIIVTAYNKLCNLTY